MINLRSIHIELGVTSSTTRTWRKKVNDHPDNPKEWGISINHMEELLTRFGYTVVQEKTWEKKSKYE